ncbi:hypothetical protein HD806DRAFT_526365 [Xylariaceae sp. AK1471]|nr:hypothetical protein HD806DRAFT_526365 [Xylariaceae sp. AK1471]
MANVERIPGDEKHVSSDTKAVLLPAWVNPDIDRLMVVKKAEAGALFARVTGVTPVSPPTYISVQAGRNLHIELNSDFVFTTHSCAPTLEWDMKQMEFLVAKSRDLKKGECE